MAQGSLSGIRLIELSVRGDSSGKITHATVVASYCADVQSEAAHLSSSNMVDCNVENDVDWNKRN